MIRLLSLLLLSATTLAQAPPTCPAHPLAGSNSSTLTVTQPAARPTTEQVHQTLEAAASDPTVLLATEPENFGVARYRLEDYADCTGNGGCYWADINAQTARAEGALKALVAARKAGEKLALVLDIDETSLSSYCEMRREDYGYIKPMYDAWTISSEASTPIPGTVRLFEMARASGISVFFITGRPEEQRSATIANLKTAGYDHWTGLSLRAGDQKRLSTVAYKSAERQKIVSQGYRILMSVGDQWSDLNGYPRADVSVKLPNPFYYLP